MSDNGNTSSGSSERYFLEDRERWESLGFDWQSWNATVARILRQQSAVSPGDGNEVRPGHPGDSSRVSS